MKKKHAHKENKPKLTVAHNKLIKYIMVLIL